MQIVEIYTHCVKFGVDSFIPFSICCTNIYNYMKDFPTFYKNNILHSIQQFIFYHLNIYHIYPSRSDYLDCTF